MTAQAAFLAALAALRTDRPGDYLAVLAEVAGMTAQCRVDKETFDLTCTEKAITLTPAPHPDLYVATSRTMLISIVEGDVTLMVAIRSCALQLKGETAALARLARAQRRFAQGAARSRRVQRTFDAFRTGD